MKDNKGSEIQNKNDYKIFDNLQDDVVIYDVMREMLDGVADLRVKYINNASILNEIMPPEEAIGKTVTELFDEDAIALNLKIAGEVLKSGDCKKYETYFKPLGRYYSVSAYLLDDNTYITISTDITEHKKAGEAVSHANKDLEQTFNAVPDLIAILDNEHKVIRANKAMAKRLGVSPEECVGLPCYKVVHGTTEPPSFCPHSQLLEDGLEHTTEVYEENLGGNFLVSVSPLYDFEGKLMGSVHVARDINKRKRAEEEKQELLEKVQQFAEELKVSNEELQDTTKELQVVNEELRQQGVELLQVNQALHESEQRVRLKLESILSPEEDIGNLDLADIIDVPAVQSLMDDFYKLTGIPIGIIDLKGNVLVGVGWQDICTKFHRVHPETCKHCIESDTQLSKGVSPGEFKLYKCKNNMWDIATPIMIGGQHFGNIFLGQFFFDDEQPDYELFRKQAIKYGFNEEEYIAALKAVPRLSKKTVNESMTFYMKLADIISQMSYNNIKLAKSLAERDILMESLQESEERMSRSQEIAHIGSWELDLVNNYLFWSDEVYRIFGLQPQEFGATYEAFLEAVYPDDREAVDEAYSGSIQDGRDTYEIEHRVLRKSTGEIRIVHEKCEHFRNESDQIIRSVGMVHDITERKMAEEQRQELLEEVQQFAEELQTSNEELQDTTEELQITNEELRATADELQVANEELRLSRDELVQTNQALQESEEKFLKAFHANPAAMTLNDADGRYIDVNESYSKLTGYSRDELIGHTSAGLNIINTEKRKQYLLELEENGSKRGIEFEMQTKSGEKRIIISSSESIILGSEISFISFIYDITERKQAEEALLESENEFRTLAENSPDVIARFDRQHRHIYANPASAEPYGHSQEYIIGKTHNELGMDPEKIEFWERHHEKVFTSGKPEIMEFHYISPQGKKYYFNTRIVPEFIDSEVKSVLAISRDITYIKEAEAKLKEARDNLEELVEERTVELEEAYESLNERKEQLKKQADLLNLIHDAILVRDFNDKITFWNKGAEEIYGWTHDEALGKVSQDLLQTEFSKPLDEIKAAVLTHNLWNGELVHIKRDGTKIIVSSRWSLQKDENGKPIGFMEINFDITERKKAGKQIEEQNIILEGMNKVFKEAITRPTEEEFGKACLKIVEEITVSQFSFIGEINPHRKFDSIAVSENGLNACEMVKEVGAETVNDNPIRGIRSRAIEEKQIVIFDNPSSSPHWSGLPEGHVEITSFMGIPLIYEDETIGLLALANKEGGYTSKDKENMNLLSAAITESLLYYRARTKLSESMESLRLSNIYNRSLIEASLDPLVTIGPDGKITDVNGATEAVTGYSRDELIGTDFSDYFTQPEKAREGYQQVFRDAMVLDYPLEIKHKSGHITPVLYNASVYHDESGDVIGVFAAARDITERKKAENELKLASIYNRSLIEASLDPLVTIGPDGKITDVNTSTEIVTGYSRDELIGTDFSDYFTEPEEAREGYQHVFQEGFVRDYPLEIQHKNGNVTSVLYNASVYEDESGEVIGVFAAARDITERKKAENQLNEIIDELKRSNDELEQFAYITSHDLQEPLRNIASFAQLLDRRYKGKLDSDADEFLDYMVDGASRMKQMILGLLDYSRVGTQGEELKPMNMEGAVDQSLSNLKTAIEESNAIIDVDPLPTVVADKHQIVRLFQNIIGNAIKFRKEDGSPKIHISAREDKENNEYIFSVSDNGIGMESQYTDQIFKVFKRLHSIGKYPGAGIGLSITKRIIERHGGHIWVESEFGDGSTFYFTLSKPMVLTRQN